MTEHKPSMVTQRILADPTRGDGHDADGNPGDCLRACVASLLGEPYDTVPHFARHHSWWDYMRRWARARGGDFACLDATNVRDSLINTPPGMLIIGSGPSPRGPFRHVVIVDLDLQLVHDPHPSRAGLIHVDDVIAYVQTYQPPPQQLALCAAR